MMIKSVTDRSLSIRVVPVGSLGSRARRIEQRLKSLHHYAHVWPEVCLVLYTQRSYRSQLVITTESNNQNQITSYYVKVHCFYCNSESMRKSLCEGN